MTQLLQHQFKFAYNLGRLLQYIFQEGYTCTMGESFRTPEQQAIYLKKGLTKTSNSRHMQRLAVDINIFKDGQLLTKSDDYLPFAKYWQQLSPDNVAGAYWGWDAGHFEMKP